MKTKPYEHFCPTCGKHFFGASLKCEDCRQVKTDRSAINSYLIAQLCTGKDVYTRSELLKLSDMFQVSYKTLAATLSNLGFYAEATLRFDYARYAHRRRSINADIQKLYGNDEVIAVARAYAKPSIPEIKQALRQGVDDTRPVSKCIEEAVSSDRAEEPLISPDIDDWERRREERVKRLSNIKKRAVLTKPKEDKDE